MRKISPDIYIQSHGMPIDDDLAAAIKQNDLETVANLLRHGSLVHSFCSRGLPAFVEAKTKEMVQLLVSFGLKVDTPIFSDNTTLLSIRSDSNDLEFLGTLISCGADVNATSMKGETGLFHAVMGENPKSILFLLQNGANINAKDVEGESPLSWAVFFDKRLIVDLLLANGADPNLEDCKGESILEAAVIHFQPDRLPTLERLIESGANVNHQRKSDKSAPLHMACRRDYAEVVELLLAHGANPQLKNSFGETPYDLAVENEAFDSMKILERWK